MGDLTNTIWSTVLFPWYYQVHSILNDKMKIKKTIDNSFTIENQEIHQ